MLPADFLNALKATASFKDWPAWLFTALLVFFAILFFVPVDSADILKEYRPFFAIGLVLFAVVTPFKWSAIGWAAYRKYQSDSKARKTYHATVQRAHWVVTPQTDGSVVTQISVQLKIKNTSAASVGLMRARIIRPRIKGEILTDFITVRHQRAYAHGTPSGHDYRCEPGTVTPAQISMLIRGAPRCARGSTIEAVLGIIDDEGNEQRIKATCAGLPLPQPPEQESKIEGIHGIIDPTEKELASVLQSELSRYAKNGRTSGGLGSLHLIYRGQKMHSFAGDSWTPRSSDNQEIATDPEAAALASDNLDAMLALFNKLTSADERDGFSAALQDRLQQDRGYARVAYFIVCVLWKIGRLDDALEAVKFGLPENDAKTFGVGNVLMMFNGLLRYRHPDFSSDMLDDLSRFLEGSEEPPFQIPQKIAAIRSARLLAPAARDLG